MLKSSFVIALWAVVLVVSVEAGDSQYVQSRSAARRNILQYCQLQCEQCIGRDDGWCDIPRLPYRATFEAAMQGDFCALDTVFTRWEYHSGCIELWHTIPWQLLQVIGDKRFAAFVVSRPLAEQPEAVRYLSPCAENNEMGAWEGHFQRHYPATYSLYEKYWSR